MKKLLITLLTFAALAIPCSYIFIPSKIKIASTKSITANHEGVFRILSDTNSWGKWWPGNNKENLSHNDFHFSFNKFLYNQIELNIGGDNILTLGNLKIFPATIDSGLYELDAEINAGSNPVNRITSYFKARKIKTAFDDILLALKTYVTDQRNLYGLDIRKEKVQYSYLIFTKKTIPNYPTIQQVYGIVEELRTYAAKSGAGEIFYPMLNIKQIDSSTYEAQVGLPVDKKLPDTESISTKWMMKEGNILSVEVTGGQQQIEEAFKKFELYILENKRSVIAIPFQMLITDRTKEPDSSKWVTKLYYPVV